MGFFSWVTQDSGKSISNKYSSRGSFPVIMIDNKGNRWEEKDYEGYGVFGGKEYFVLLAEMNVCDPNKLSEDDLFAIGMCMERRDGILHPNFVENPDAWEYIPTAPDKCEDQGFFYK